MIIKIKENKMFITAEITDGLIEIKQVLDKSQDTILMPLADLMVLIQKAINDGKSQKIYTHMETITE